MSIKSTLLSLDVGTAGGFAGGFITCYMWPKIVAWAGRAWNRNSTAISAAVEAEVAKQLGKVTAVPVVAAPVAAPVA